MAEQDRLGRSLDALALLHAQEAQDRDAVMETLSPQVQAAVGMALASLGGDEEREVAQVVAELRASQAAAQELLVGMSAVASALAHLASGYSGRTVTDVLRDTDGILRQAYRSGQPQ